MQRTIVDGVSMWSAWQPRHDVFFNSYFITGLDGNLATDPLALDDAGAEEIESEAAWRGSC